MLDLIESIYRLKNFYHWSLTIGDRRVEEWPLMKTPMPTIYLSGAYLLVVALGPALMRPYKPFDLRKILVLYNIGVMLLNLYIVVQLVISSVELQYSWLCQPVDYSPGFHEVNIAGALWWYYMSKLIEFLDTAFFVLRKKNEQLTFLHVYHHCTMFILWWIGVKYVAGGSSFLAAMTNSFVHVIMYAYYGLSAIGPHVRKYLWWKKYLTCIQLVQFTSAGVLGIRALIVGCDFPLWMQYALVIYMASFVFLFGKFFAEAYGKQERKQKKA